MTLISFHDRPKLLYIIIENNGQPWLSTSTINAQGKTPARYTPETFLKDWQPIFAIGVKPQ